MEVLVHWFTDNLSQHLSREMVIYHFHDSDSGASRRTSGGITSESIRSKSHPNLYYRKYYPDSVYPAFYPADL